MLETYVGLHLWSVREIAFTCKRLAIREIILEVNSSDFYYSQMTKMTLFRNPYITLSYWSVSVSLSCVVIELLPLV